jgi:hypothetical protein
MGGQQRGVPHWTREWKLFQKALVIKLENGQLQRVLEYETPPEHCPDESPAIVFKAGSIQGDIAYLCTQTEVLICDFPSFAIRRVITHCCFNDLHHVAPAPDGRLFVVVTGLDAVAELAPDGTLLRLVSVLGGSVWDRFSQSIDYRKVPTTKPHLAHPNFVFFIDGQPWVTRFQQRDAVPLDGNGNGRPPFAVGTEGIHEGHVTGDDVYFTTVNGLIVRFNLKTGRRLVFDLNTVPGRDTERPLGWCRGILPMGDQAWVGFTRLRYTTLRHNLDWVRHGFRQAERYPPSPTRIAHYDLETLTLIEEIDLEGVGLNAIFSVHHA